MIDKNQYLEKIRDYFSFLIQDYNYILIKEKIMGNFYYDVQYTDKIKIVSVSYENIEDYLQVIISMLQNGKHPNYNVTTKTLHLNKLNEIIFPIVDENEIGLNNQYFLKFQPSDEFEKKILKSAKELRLCLNHFDEINFQSLN